MLFYWDLAWVTSITFEPAHDKTQKETCVTSTDTDQPVHPTRVAIVYVRASLYSPEAIRGACDQQRL